MVVETGAVAAAMSTVVDVAVAALIEVEEEVDTQTVVVIAVREEEAALIDAEAAEVSAEEDVVE